MLSWPIRAARDSGIFEDVIISTDSHEISSVAQNYRASVPQLRDDSLSDDMATVSDVIRDAIERLNINEDIIALIYATAAGIQPDDLRAAVGRLQEDSHADFVLSICAFPHPPQRSLSVKSGTVLMKDTRAATVRTQDLEPLYHDAAQFVVGRRQAWADGKTVWNSRTIPHIVPTSRAVDIDEPDDWTRAERLLAPILSHDAAS